MKEDHTRALEETVELAGGPIDIRNFEVCLCHGAVPTVPPHCPAEAPTCGAYPNNDPNKLPVSGETLDDAALESLCITHGQIYNEALAKRICAPVVAKRMDSFERHRPGAR